MSTIKRDSVKIPRIFHFRAFARQHVSRSTPSVVIISRLPKGKSEKEFRTKVHCIFRFCSNAFEKWGLTIGVKIFVTRILEVVSVRNDKSGSKLISKSPVLCQINLDGFMFPNGRDVRKINDLPNGIWIKSSTSSNSGPRIFRSTD